MTQTNLTGRTAITVAEMLGLTLNKYADPTDTSETRAAGISVEVAREIAKEDPSLIWLDGAMAAAAIDDDAIRTLRTEATQAGDLEMVAICDGALLRGTMMRDKYRVECARVIAEARAHA